MSKKEQQWDEKAKNYSRYNPDDSRFEAKLLDKMTKKGIDFSAKTIIDVGCGTGVYTLRLAKEAKSVDALDFSLSMLEVLEHDAKELGLENIFTCKTSWSDYESQKNYDIAFSTMSPALDNDEEYQKFHAIAKTKIYLGWAGVRDSDVLGALFDAHGKKNSAPNGAAKLKAWLQKNHISYTAEEIEELKISTCSCADAPSKYRWHLEMREIEVDEKILKEILEKFCKDDIVTERTLNKMNLIIWN